MGFSKLFSINSLLADSVIFWLYGVSTELFLCIKHGRSVYWYKKYQVQAKVKVNTNFKYSLTCLLDAQTLLHYTPMIYIAVYVLTHMATMCPTPTP